MIIFYYVIINEKIFGEMQPAYFFTIRVHTIIGAQYISLETIDSLCLDSNKTQRNIYLLFIYYKRFIRGKMYFAVCTVTKNCYLVPKLYRF